MPLVVLNGPIIAAGESLSDALDCTGSDIVRLTMPADWTDAALTFQISTDGLFYNNLFNHHGEEVSLPVIPGVAIVVPVDFLRAAAFIKFRSGTHQAPKPQLAQREFAVAVASGNAIGELAALPIRLVT
ncbi:hypothetical protein JQ581_29950 [Bradyrhizobium liaoningense]|uniref:hypothetical protein n=1 Tax=Bradyrhizobium liaoningense TaxID=43992 RepID=UPI001BAB2950|nr:hypothetical protein [Bradyrhizobium liaoningense]MBR0741163.1 hypothetical protein [Bradyrhizobium liaoningense]